MLKSCKKCGLEKDEESEFYRTRPGRWGSTCKGCKLIEARAYRQLNKEKYKQYSKVWHKKHRSEIRKRNMERNKRLIEQRKQQPCADCGLTLPYWVMEFDHLPSEEEKCFSINKGGLTATLTVLMHELEKCEVVCAVCHSYRTYLRSNGLPLTMLAAFP